MLFLQYIADFIRLTWRFRYDTEAKIKKRQQQDVMGLLAFVRPASPFYRELYNGYEVRSLEDFAGLPTIDKGVMMANFDRLNTAGLRLNDVMRFALDKELRKDYLGYYQIVMSSGFPAAHRATRAFMQPTGQSHDACPVYFWRVAAYGFQTCLCVFCLFSVFSVRVLRISGHRSSVWNIDRQ
jgi:hypothetical protein